jgi:hypothetical protein
MCLEYMVNHISPGSPQFQDYKAHGDASAYKDMFVRWKDVWASGGGHSRTLAKHGIALLHPCSGGDVQLLLLTMLAWLSFAGCRGRRLPTAYVHAAYCLLHMCVLQVHPQLRS